MPTQHQIRQQITSQIVAALQQGCAPWRRPWQTDPNAGAPANAVSRRCYSGVNPLLLQIAAERHGFQSRWWGTYRQWSEIGGQVMSRPGHVPSGKWGTQIVFCRPVTKTTVRDGEEQDETYWSMRTYTVFNADQVLGSDVDRFRIGSTEAPTTEIDERFKRAEAVVEATGADIRYGGNQALYHFGGDYIQMPQQSQFSQPDFYNTLFHEMTHWTEHPTRLNWDRSLPDNTYALGELIAEIGACYLAGELGLPLERSLGNHAAYVANWLKAMQNDSRFVFRAAAQATKAADFILSFSRQSEPESVLTS